MKFKSVLSAVMALYILELLSAAPATSTSSELREEQSKYPNLRPLISDRMFQIIGVDVVELLKTIQGNLYVVVFLDVLSKFPLVFPVLDQKSIGLPS